MIEDNDNNLRSIMESAVIGVNKHLKDVVGNIHESDLLANMHPSDRKFFSINMYNSEPVTFRSEREGRRSYM